MLQDNVKGSAGNWEQDLGGGVVVDGGLQLVEIDTRRVSSQGLKGCECPAQVDLNLVDTAGIKLNVGV